MFPIRPDSVAADSALTVTTLNPAISTKNPSILRLFINVLARSLARLNLFFDLACLCTSIVHQPLVRLNFFQHRNKTIRISNSVRFEFILDLIQTLRNAQTLELDGVIDVETDRLLIDQSIEKSRQLHHFLSVREIEDGFSFFRRQFYGQVLAAQIGNLPVGFIRSALCQIVRRLQRCRRKLNLYIHGVSLAAFELYLSFRRGIELDAL